MFERVLYPTDFSDVSRKTLACLKGLAGAGVKEVVVLHVVDERTLKVLEQHAPTVAAHYEDVARDEIREDLKRVVAELQEAGFQVRAMVKLGVPLVEILKAEEEEGVTAIILGSHGRTNLQEVLMGSVSEKVMRRCKKPVLVIKR
jgi:nucleotide-binding universal stress UspA family protein